MFDNKFLNKKEVFFAKKLYEVYEYEKCIKWFLNGKLHREGDRPALLFKNGTKEWYLNGKKHRKNDKPAVIRHNGDKEWYIEGVRHRANGLPAIISKNKFFYFENGKELNKEEVKFKYKIYTF